METIALILVIILFILAFSDLIVGVSNDAVNFLNAAVGSRATGFKVILAVAAIGIICGATFSSGMMEVARKGIFHPEYFFFSEIIILFLAVMVTDVILLDTFNTLGLPTSTTVSLVFELLGAAVALAAIKVFTSPDDALHLYQYINSPKALAMISGILISVVVAFSTGAVVQYLSRLIFSFDYEKRVRTIGPIWAGFGIMAITYFLFIKGLDGAVFISEDIRQLILSNTLILLLGSFLFWMLTLFLLNRLFQVNILQVVVLIGTFALAMAFASNDLVNFIGVPMAGYNSWQLFQASGAGADEFLMNGLAGEVPTAPWLLLFAGLVMAVTLAISKKARTVLKTSVDLGRQESGEERFESFKLSRSLVRRSTAISQKIQSRTPARLKELIARQFDQNAFTRRQIALGKEAPAFDMVRASVTLIVASILITIGTILKLPLSTTYVTFMVFMGASLADGAWGRESAVYRVSGMLAIIGGWFFTAFSAFTAAFILAVIFYFGGIIAIVLVLLLAAYLVYRTHRNFQKEEDPSQSLERTVTPEGMLTRAESIALCSRHLDHFIEQYNHLIKKCLQALGDEDLAALQKVNKKFKPVETQIMRLNLKSSLALERMPEQDLEAGQLYILILDYLEEMSKYVKSILGDSLAHVDNNHKPLLPEQIDELMELHLLLSKSLVSVSEAFRQMDSQKVSQILHEFPEVVKFTRKCRKDQIRRIKNHAVGTRNGILYFGLLGEFRNLALFGTRILRVFEDLILNPVDQDAREEVENA